VTAALKWGIDSEEKEDRMLGFISPEQGSFLGGEASSLASYGGALKREAFDHSWSAASPLCCAGGVHNEGCRVIFHYRGGQVLYLALVTPEKG